jgi:hypothetical protein
MPMPTPHAGESRNDFVSRCMGDRVMRTDFPDQAQRAAVCNRQWRSKPKSGTARDMIDALERPWDDE